MKPRIEISEEKKLIGKHLKMSLTENRVNELWQSFMSHRKEIMNNLTGDLTSMSVYPTNYFGDFNPANEFDNSFSDYYFFKFGLCICRQRV